MSVTLSVQDILDQHVVLETEGIDRLKPSEFRRGGLTERSSNSTPRQPLHLPGNRRGRPE